MGSWGHMKIVGKIINAYILVRNRDGGNQFRKIGTLNRITLLQ